jgi:hypothetical protein
MTVTSRSRSTSRRWPSCYADAMAKLDPRLILVAALALAACGPDLVASSAGGDETGGEDVAPGHWLLYTSTTSNPDATEIISVRAVDLGALAQGQLGTSIELLETEGEIVWLGPTPWGGHAFELDDAHMLVGLDADGHIELYPGVPEGVPPKVRRPVFSADGSAAIFHGEYNGAPDSYYWVRYEHGHPVAAQAIAQMPAQNGNPYWITPNGQYGVIDQRDAVTNEIVQMRFTLDPEPGELAPLWDSQFDGFYLAALFDEHLFAWGPGQLHAGAQLFHVDTSTGDTRQISLDAILGSNDVWYSPTGDMVVWVDVEYLPEEEEHGRLWRVDIVDGVPLPAVELTEPGELVEQIHLYFPGDGLVAWRPLADGQITTTQLRWVDFVDGQLGPIRTVEEGATVGVAAFSPDGHWLSWTGMQGGEPFWGGLATLDGPLVVHHLDQFDPSGSPTWIDNRLLYTTSGTALWWTLLGEDGPGSSTSVLGPGANVATSDRILGHDAALILIDYELHVLRFTADGPLAAVPVDDAPGTDRARGQIIRE